MAASVRRRTSVHDPSCPLYRGGVEGALRRFAFDNLVGLVGALHFLTSRLLAVTEPLCRRGDVEGVLRRFAFEGLLGLVGVLHLLTGPLLAAAERLVAGRAPR